MIRESRDQMEDWKFSLKPKSSSRKGFGLVQGYIRGWFCSSRIIWWGQERVEKQLKKKNPDMTEVKISVFYGNLEVT